MFSRAKILMKNWQISDVLLASPSCTLTCHWGCFGISLFLGRKFSFQNIQNKIQVLKMRLPLKSTAQEIGSSFFLVSPNGLWRLFVLDFFVAKFRNDLKYFGTPASCVFANTRKNCLIVMIKSMEPTTVVAHQFQQMYVDQGIWAVTTSSLLPAQ